MAEPPPYEVGRGRPPRHTRFRKGQSGNPAGRPKGARGLRQVLVAELLKEVTAKENGRPVRLPALGAVARVMIGDAVRGNTKVALALLYLGLKLDAPDLAAQTEVDEAPPEPEDEAILAAYRRRIGGGGDG